MKQYDDDKLWNLAQKRVAFRRHFFVYVLVNISLVVLWYFTEYKSVRMEGDKISYWFIYPLFGWGIGVAFHYWNAFHDDAGSIEKEYSKLKERQQKISQDSETPADNIPPQP